MLIEEKFTIKSPIRESWDFLLNPETIGPCIPGCEKIVASSDKEYESVIAAKVGPIAVRFKVKSVIDEIQPYTFIHTVGEGKELRNLGSFKQKTSIRLNELSKDETEVSYRSEVSVVGRLATFGDRVLRHKASEIGKEFAEHINREISIQNKDLPPQPVSETGKVSLISRLVTFFKKIWRRFT
jgi:carbon monoxide dehydrogenase subunit G